MKEGYQNYEDPIELSEMLETTAKNLDDSTNITNLNYNTASTVSNIDSQILLKKDQLIKMKNDELNKQINNLQNYESSIINKDRLIENINDNIEKDNSKIRFLYFTIILMVLGIILIMIYSSGFISELIFKILITIGIFIFFVALFYTFNILYFRTFVNYIDYRRNLRLEESVKDWTNFTKTNLQTKLYGDKNDWEDENCDCPPSEEVFPEEPNVSVKTTPGYYYYDGNAPKQLVVNNEIKGGEAVNVSDNPELNPEPKIFDKIKWVDHDNYTYSIADEEGSYNIRPNDYSRYKNGLLVNNSTYTSNL